MQTVTLASALVASVAYATNFSIELKNSDDAVWATTDVTVDWKVADSAAETIQMFVKGEFALSDGDYRAVNHARAQWFFCWNDTNECWTTKNSDESNAGEWYLQNYIVMSEGKRTHSGNTWPSEYGASTDWWVFYSDQGETEWTVDIANPIYNADFAQNEFTDAGWTTQSYRLWDHCEPEYDEIVYGLTREGTLGMFAQTPNEGPQFASKQVTVEFAPATGQQKAALGYVEPSDPTFKQNCADKTISDELTEFLAGEDDQNADVDDQEQEGDGEVVDPADNDTPVVVPVDDGTPDEDDTPEEGDTPVDDGTPDEDDTPEEGDTPVVDDGSSQTCSNEATAVTNKCIGVACTDDAECASGDCWSTTSTCGVDLGDLEDAASKMGAGLIVLFILLPICCCLCLCWLTCYCCVWATKSAIQDAAQQRLNEGLLENDAQQNR